MLHNKVLIKTEWKSHNFIKKQRKLCQRNLKPSIRLQKK